LQEGSIVFEAVANYDKSPDIMTGLRGLAQLF